MKISNWIGSQIKTVVISDNVNRLDIDELRKNIIEANSIKTIHLDLSKVDFVDWSFINLMIEIKIKFPDIYRKIKIINPNDFVIDVLKMMFVDMINDVFHLKRRLT
jgi:anti-anti-sigma regulatory factor